MISLGPFVLIGSVGSGGMSVVYRGVHRQTRRAVAVKVLTRDLARQERHRLAFQREVRAMARLHHRSIGQIYDMGVISEQEADASAGRLIAGSPWLAMELVNGRPLSEWRGLDLSQPNTSQQDVSQKTPWQQLFSVFVKLLEALAHAHANGVIHCDLKPSNVLIGPSETGAPAVKVIDFGLTRLFGSDTLGTDTANNDADEAPVVGTPPYMAPEQILGEWREQGPWTDMYAFGCLAWKQLTGDVPFVRDTTDAILRAHLKDDLPSFEPLFAVPDGIEGWLRRLLDKSSARRFRRAADALQALHMVSGTVWEQAAASRTDVKLAPDGIGLRLFGVRQVPMVSRKDEREQLWQAFNSAVDAKSPRAAVLLGAAGFGKSRLARWLANRAHETGAATIMHLTHSPHAGPHDGIGPMLVRYFQCGGLQGSALMERLRSICSTLYGFDDDTSVHTSAVELAALMGADTAATAGFRSPLERHNALLRLLEACARRRPLLVWMDEVHWGLESADFLHHLLSCELSYQPLPIYVVATVRSDLLEESPSVAKLIDAICASSCVDKLEVGRLSDTEQRELVDQALALDERLAEQVVQRTAGSPLFALQLLGYLVETGRLERRQQVFSASEAALSSLPADIGELWRLRLDNLCSPVEPLEVAAAMGLFVDDTEWRQVCARVGVDAPRSLVDELARLGLVRLVDGGWQFEFTSLHQTLSERSERSRTYHAACAQVLASLYEPTARGVSLRLCRHLIESGQLREALAPLLRAEKELYDAGDFAGSAQCLDRREALLDQLDVAPDDPLRAQNGWRRARLLYATGERERATELVEESLARLRSCGQAAEIGPAALLYGRMLRDHGDLVAARDQLDEAQAAYRAVGDHSGLANVVSSIGYLELMTGDHRSALDRFEQALSAFEALDDTLMRGRIHLITGHTLLFEEKTEASALHVEEALRLTRLAGDRPTEAEALRCLGEIARARQDWAEARRCYASALDLHEICGTRIVHVVRADLALTHLACDDFSEAQALLEVAEQRYADVGYGARLPFVYAALLACAAGQEDRAGWQRYLELSQSALEQTTTAHRDIEWAAKKAAELARQAGWDDAELAEALAQAQRQSLS